MKLYIKMCIKCFWQGKKKSGFSGFLANPNKFIRNEILECELENYNM